MLMLSFIDRWDRLNDVSYSRKSEKEPSHTEQKMRVRIVALVIADQSQLVAWNTGVHTT